MRFSVDVAANMEFNCSYDYDLIVINEKTESGVRHMGGIPVSINRSRPVGAHRSRIDIPK